MSVQSTGTPLKSPDYKRLRADDLASDSTKHCGSAAIRRPDTQSTISDLNEQFASMTLRTGALQDLMNSVTWKTPKTEASTPSLRRLDGGHAGIPYEGAPQEKKRERERERERERVDNTRALDFCRSAAKCAQSSVTAKMCSQKCPSSIFN